MVMKDADFRHVSWVIANDDRLTHVCRQREIEVPQALEMNAIRAYFATLGHGQQQQIELVEALRQSGEKITAMVGIERRRNPCDLPVWHSLTPNGLAQCQGRLDGRGSLQAEPETGNGPAVIVHDDGQPGTH